jgi:outer membrane protein, heavy metal efflux system
MRELEMSFLLRIVFVVAAGVLPNTPAGDESPQTRLRTAIERAVAQNPDVASMEARIGATRRRVAQSTALPDPELEVGIKDIPPSHPSLTRDDFTMEMIAARQRFPGLGKRLAQQRVVQAELGNALAEHARHVIEIAADVTDSFFHLAELDRRIAILVDTRQRLSDAVIAARERYRVGKGAQADVLRADLEKTALQDRLASLKAARRSETARWNALQNLPAPTAVMPIAPDGELEKEVARLPVPALEELLGEAEQKSPMIAGAKSQIRRAEQQLEQARLERRPDWTLSGYYGRREKFEDLAGLSVSFNLPWVHPRRLDERRAEGEAELEAARADLTAARNALRRDVDQAFAELEKNREQAALYSDSILPQAEINYRAAREAYSVGAIDFLTYVRAATDLDVYQGESVERQAGIGRALAALQKASGIALIAGTPAGEEIHANK